MPAKSPASSTASPPVLEVRRTIRAPRQRVFDAWTKPEEVKRWSAPGPLAVERSEIDLRVGGAYKLYMQAPDGTKHRAVGVYREVDPPNRLVYTWSWETEPGIVDTVVTVDFVDMGGGATDVVIRHAGLGTEKQRESHSHGWSGILEKLSSFV